jgi:hypothetical protein
VETARQLTFPYNAVVVEIIKTQPSVMWFDSPIPPLKRTTQLEH